MTKNYVYGALEPNRMEEAVNEAIYLAHQYRNRLCELELERRAEVDRIVRELCDEYVQACHAVTSAEEQIEEIYKTVRKRGQKERRKPRPTDKEMDDIQRLKGDLKPLRKMRAATKKEAFARKNVSEALDKVNEQHNQNVKEARANCGLYWGTYLTVEDSAKDFKNGPPPRFKPFLGEGKIAVQIQKGMSDGEAYACEDKRLCLEIKGKKASQVWMRIGSIGRDPIWTTVPIIWHRNLPKGSRIKWAYLERTKIASDTEWRLRLTITCDEQIRLPKLPREFVALHVGWRVIAGERIQTARWLGTDGKSGDVIIPAKYVDALKKADDLRSIRRVRFNKAQHRLCQWIDSNPNIPDWLREARSKIKLWKTQRKLVKLLTHWKENRFEGDEVVFKVLHGLQSVKKKGWRKRDKHLWIWECRIRKRVSRWRMWYYRNEASALSKQYGRVTIVAGEWAEMKKKPQPGEAEHQTTVQRRNSGLAAVAELNRVILEAFGKDCLIDVDRKGITTTCHLCGFNNRNVDKSLTHHTCENCATKWHLDDNGVRNQVARGQVVQKEI